VRTSKLEELLATMQRLERKVDAVLRPPPQLLSKRAAAKMLGIDRGSTLEGLIRQGHLRLVMGKIPQIEIERVLSNGLPEPKQRGRRRPHHADEASAIRKVEV
jgi:hypothetical protein